MASALRSESSICRRGIDRRADRVHLAGQRGIGELGGAGDAGVERISLGIGLASRLARERDAVRQERDSHSETRHLLAQDLSRRERQVVENAIMAAKEVELLNRVNQARSAREFERRASIEFNYHYILLIFLPPIAG